MANIVVGVFDEYANAEAARDELITAGIDPLQIRITDRQQSPPHSEEAPHEHSAFWDNIRDYFGIDDDTDEDSEAAQSPESRLLGGAVMTVIAVNENVTTIMDIIQRHEPQNLTSRSTTAPNPDSGDIGENIA